MQIGGYDLTAMGKTDADTFLPGFRNFLIWWQVPRLIASLK
jgi:hypothetical protein